MTERNYEGDPMDVSWSTPPWQNEGETVGVAVSDGDGSVEYTNVGAVVDELNDYQLGKLIRAMRRDGLRYSDIRDELGVGNHTITDAAYGRGRFSEFGEMGERLEKHKQGVLTNSGEVIADIRNRLLDGGSLEELADDYDASQATISRYAKGEKTIDPDDPPAIEYDASGRGWYIPGGGSGGSTSSEDGYSCEYCGDVFDQPGGLGAHVKNEHRDEEPEPDEPETDESDESDAETGTEPTPRPTTVDESDVETDRTAYHVAAGVIIGWLLQSMVRRLFRSGGSDD